jgi:hypothetical protein
MKNTAFTTMVAILLTYGSVTTTTQAQTPLEQIHYQFHFEFEQCKLQPQIQQECEDKAQQRYQQRLEEYKAANTANKPYNPAYKDGVIINKGIKKNPATVPGLDSIQNQ